MSTPEPPVRRPRPRAGLAVQLGQTLLVLGVGVVVFGFLLHDAGSASWVGAALAVVGAVLLVVGLRRRRAPSE
jgi:membrane-bound ClpP family serine protease